METDYHERRVSFVFMSSYQAVILNSSQLSSLAHRYPATLKRNTILGKLSYVLCTTEVIIHTTPGYKQYLTIVRKRTRRSSAGRVGPPPPPASLFPPQLSRAEGLMGQQQLTVSGE